MPELCAMAATSPPASARPKPIILEPFDRRESMWRSEFGDPICGSVTQANMPPGKPERFMVGMRSPEPTSDACS